MAEWRDMWKHLDKGPEVLACLRECEGGLGVALNYLRLRRFGGPRDITIRGAGVIRVETYEDLATAWVIFFRREYRVPADARTILDLGANIGCFTLFAASQRPAARIVSVEPFPPTFARLSATVKRNNLELRVNRWPLGVGAATGHRVIPASSAPSQSLGMLADGADAGARATSISVQSFDEMIDHARSELAVSEIDFVKMDVEGAEHEAIAAASLASLGSIRAVAMEYHPNGDKAALFGKLADGGLMLDDDRHIGPAAGVAHFSRR